MREGEAAEMGKRALDLLAGFVTFLSWLCLHGLFALGDRNGPGADRLSRFWLLIAGEVRGTLGLFRMSEGESGACVRHMQHVYLRLHSPISHILRSGRAWYCT